MSKKTTEAAGAANGEAQSTAVSKANQFTQEMVPGYVQQMEDALAALNNNLIDRDRKLENSVWENGVDLFSKNTTLCELLRVDASVHARVAAYDASVARYNIENAPAWSYNGGTFEDWKMDLEKAIAENRFGQESAFLKREIEEMKSLLSEEMKRAAKIEGIVKRSKNYLK